MTPRASGSGEELGGAGLARLVALGRELRRRGLPVGTGRILTFCRAAALLPFDRASLYWAGRAALISRPEDVPAYDAAFEAWSREGLLPEEEGPPAPGLPVPGGGVSAEGGDVGAGAGSVAASWRAADGEEPEGEAALRIVASAAEVLRSKSFDRLTEEERARTDRLIRQLEVRLPDRRTRRRRPHPKGDRFDVPRTLRRSLRTQGEPFHRAWRARRTRTRPLVLLLDVSGSMAPYSRALVQFAYAAMAAGRRVEVFCFGTRLTRVTRVLRTRDPDRALHEIGRAVEDWEGGTRIGDSLRALLEAWGQRAALRGAVVVLCSDGLERGDPEALRQAMARLRRLAHRVVWVNPLKGSPRYEPLARGMAAALPSIDVFLPGHDLASLEELAAVLGG
jgi:uncharacterized protein with von Willebrand factor type A (vWA) domain